MADANDIRATLDRIQDRLARHGDTLTAEDAIKTVLVAPLLAAMGHDPSDPDLVQVGHKTAEGRADYSVLDADGGTTMLVAISSNPTDPDSQRARNLAALFGTGARIGVLTDGRRHRFHLLSSDGLDQDPFLSFDIGDGTDPAVLLPLTREHFDVEAAIAAARTTRPADIAWDFLLDQAGTEGEVHSTIMEHLLEHGVPKERADAGASDALRRLGRIMRGEELAVEPVVEETADDDERRPLTGDEMAAMEIVKQVVGRYVDPGLVYARPAKSYLALLLTNNNRKTICRLYLLSRSARYVGTFVGREETRQSIKTYSDVGDHALALLERLRELDPGAFHDKPLVVTPIEPIVPAEPVALAGTPSAEVAPEPVAADDAVPATGTDGHADVAPSAEAPASDEAPQEALADNAGSTTTGDTGGGAEADEFRLDADRDDGRPPFVHDDDHRSES